MDPVEVGCCIIGAGFAGLAAGHQLRRAGKSVAVLEARRRRGAERRLGARGKPDGRLARLVLVADPGKLLELRMKRVIVLAAIVLVVASSQAGMAAPVPFKRAKVLTPLEKKILGTWEGQGGCDGRFVFRSDGTYELKEYGPGNSHTAGTFGVQGDSLPATLRLTCKTSKIAEEVGKTTELKLITLVEKSLAIEYAQENGSPSGRYTRVRK